MVNQQAPRAGPRASGQALLSILAVSSFILTSSCGPFNNPEQKPLLSPSSGLNGQGHGQGHGEIKHLFLSPLKVPFILMLGVDWTC
jgi:hypothetical protein